MPTGNYSESERESIPARTIGIPHRPTESRRGINYTNLYGHNFTDDPHMPAPRRSREEFLEYLNEQIPRINRQFSWTMTDRGVIVNLDARREGLSERFRIMRQVFSHFIGDEQAQPSIENVQVKIGEETVEIPYLVIQYEGRTFGRPEELPRFEF